MTNYTKIAVRGAVTVFIISIISAFLGYLVRLTLARNLSVGEFGLFYAVFAFLGLLGLFKTFGFDKALIKFIPEFKIKKKNNQIKSSILFVVFTQLITNTIIIILVYLFANYLSMHFFHNTQASIVLKLMAIAFFIDSFVGVLKFTFQGFQKMALFAGIDLIRMILLLIIIFIGIKLNYQLLSPIIAYIIVPIFLMFIFIPVLLKNIFPKFTKSKFILDTKTFKTLSKYGILVMSATVGTFILGYTDMVVLTYFSGVAAVGLYSIALPTARILTYIPRSIAGILLPLSSELWVKKKKILLREGMESLYKYIIIIIIPLAFIMFSFTDLIINIFFGKNYLLASNAMKILVIGMIIAPLYGINSNFFSGIGKPQINSRIVYSGAVFNLVSNLILIPLWGVIGAAITTTLSYIIMVLMSLKNIKKLVKLTLPIKIWMKTLFVGVIFASMIWFLKKVIFLNVWLETAIVLAISGLIYTALLFLLKIINIDELKDLYKRVMK